MVLAVGVAWRIIRSIYYILEGCGLEGDMEWEDEVEVRFEVECCSG